MSSSGASRPIPPLTSPGRRRAGTRWGGTGAGYFVYLLMICWSCLTASFVSWATTLR